MTQRGRFRCVLTIYIKGDPPADLRDADGFCYRLILTPEGMSMALHSDNLSENLHISGCKYNAFFLILQLFEVFF